jgi:hypothetical protein
MDTGNGAFIMSGNASVSGNTLTASGSYGGGVYAVITDTTTAYMKGNATISENKSNTGSVAGGGLYMTTVIGSSKTTFIMDENASVSGNSLKSDTTSLWGGGVYLGGFASLDMAGNASVSGNSLTVSGGSGNVYGGGVCVNSNCIGLYMYVNASIFGNTISSASADAKGGGVYVQAGEGVIYSGIIYGNSAPARLKNTAEIGTGTVTENGNGSAIHGIIQYWKKDLPTGETSIPGADSGLDTTIYVSGGVLSLLGY